MSQTIIAPEIYTQIKPHVEGELTRLAGLEKPLFGLNTSNLSSRVEEATVKLRDRISVSIGNISPEAFSAIDLRFNVPFWTQGVLENTSMMPIVDIPDQTLYPYDPSRVVPITRNPLIDNLFSAIPDQWFWRFFVQNLPDLGKNFTLWWESNATSLGERNLVVASNHITRMNLGIIAFCLHQFCRIPRENLYIVVGPKVMTHDFTAATTSQANVIKTFPNGPNGNINYGLNRLRVPAVNRMKDIMNDASSGTRVMIVAPSGGTDEHMGDGSYRMKRPSPTFQGILNTMIGERVRLALIGMDDSGIFPGNKSLKRGKVGAGFSQISDDPSLKDLPQYIADPGGRLVQAAWKADQ